MFSAVSETTPVKNQLSWVYPPFLLTLPLPPGPPLL